MRRFPSHCIVLCPTRLCQEVNALASESSSCVPTFATQPRDIIAATRPRPPHLPRASTTASRAAHLSPSDPFVDATPINRVPPAHSLRGRAAHHGAELQPVPAAVRAAPAVCSDAEPQPAASAPLLAAFLFAVAKRHVPNHGQRHPPRKASAPIAEPNLACPVPVTFRCAVVPNVALRFLAAEYRLFISASVACQHAAPAVSPATALPTSGYGTAAAAATSSKLYAPTQSALQQGYRQRRAGEGERA